MHICTSICIFTFKKLAIDFKCVVFVRDVITERNFLIWITLQEYINSTLFRKKRFALNFLTKRNASKFAMFMEKENPCSFFHFSFQVTLSLTFINALIYVDIDQGIHKGKMKVALNEKRKKLHGFSFSINIANFEAFL